MGTVIAILDDEAPVRIALGRVFRSVGFEPEYFASGPEFLESLKSHTPDCLILDLHLPGLTGMDVLAQLKSMNLALPTIMITGHDLPGMKTQALARGADDFLMKPLDSLTLIAAIYSSIQRKRPDTLVTFQKSN